MRLGRKLSPVCRHFVFLDVASAPIIIAPTTKYYKKNDNNDNYYNNNNLGAYIFIGRRRPLPPATVDHSGHVSSDHGASARHTNRSAAAGRYYIIVTFATAAIVVICSTPRVGARRGVPFNIPV